MLPVHPALARLVLAFTMIANGLHAANATGTLVNLSTRIRIPDGGEKAIVGCVLTGTGSRTLLVRAVGPGLAPFGVGGTIRDPKLTVYDSAGRAIATNNDWDAEGHATEITASSAASGAFTLAAGSKDAAAVVTVTAGSFTVHVASTDNIGGVVLIELYAVGTLGPKLMNLSVRGYAGQAADTLTAGFVIHGTLRTLLARGVGPALLGFGVQGAVSNPRVSLLDSTQKTLADNRDWGLAPDPRALAAATNATGAFRLPAGSADAALVSEVNAGSYTVQLSEETNRTGEALIEIYDVSAIDPFVTIRTRFLSSFNISPNTPAGPVKLTNLPMDFSEIGEIWPMGLTLFEHVTPIDHAYVWGLNPNARSSTYAVYAPADGFLTTISHRSSFDGVPQNDYRLTFEHSGTLFSYYDLIDAMDPTILAQVPGGLPNGGFRAVRIPVKGGQIVGRNGGKSVDFAVFDSTRPNSGFVVPDHYISEPWKVFVVDPFEAFEDAARMQLLTRALGSQNPRGGKIGYDISGRLIGTWFLEGTNGYDDSGRLDNGFWHGHLSVVYHYIDTGRIVISFGNYAGQAARQLMVAGNTPLPESVSENSGVVKYELIKMGARITGPTPLLGSDGVVQGTVLFQVLADDRLRMEIFPGKTAPQVSGFTAAAKLYER